MIAKPTQAEIEKAAELARTHKEFLHSLEVKYIDPLVKAFTSGQITADAFKSAADELEIFYTWACPTEEEPGMVWQDPLFPGLDSSVRMLTKRMAK